MVSVPSPRKFRRVAVVLPTMNEAGNIEALCRRLRKLKDRFEPLVEAIFVLNNSSDTTSAILERLSKRVGYQFLKVVRCDGARGSAIRKGVEITIADMVIVMDSDGQYDPLEIPKLMSPIIDGGCWMSIGKNRASTSFLRCVCHEIFKKITKNLLGVENVQTGFKAGFKQVLMETIPENVQGLDIDVRWANNIIAKGYANKLSEEVEVTLHPRLHGKTTFNPIVLATGLLYTTLSLFAQRRTGRELPFPKILKQLTLKPRITRT